MIDIATQLHQAWVEFDCIAIVYYMYSVSGDASAGKKAAGWMKRCRITYLKK